jgi:hypothetical protein
MHKLLFIAVAVTVALSACAEQQLASDSTNTADCRNREVRLGTNIPKRDDCTVVTDADREAAKQEAQAARDDQMRRNLSRPKATGSQ